MEIQKKKLLSKRDLCDMLDFSLGNINNMIRDNKISYYKIGKSVRFDYKEVDKFLNDCKV